MQSAIPTDYKYTYITSFMVKFITAAFDSYLARGLHVLNLRVVGVLTVDAFVEPMMMRS